MIDKLAPPFGPIEFLLILAIIAALIWSGVWKGIALWRSARNQHLAWFIVMLIVNTLGILEIIYILGFSRRRSQAQ